jgi:hypothetical protein
MDRRAFPTGHVIRILVTIGLLVAVIVTKQRCGKAAVELFRTLDQPLSVDGGVPKPLTPIDAAH